VNPASPISFARTVEQVRLEASNLAAQLAMACPGRPPSAWGMLQPAERRLLVSRLDRLTNHLRELVNAADFIEVDDDVEEREPAKVIDLGDRR